MIQVPRRSVTRFFIPMIDVLILLFCIFLLMPFVSVPPEDAPADQSARPSGALDPLLLQQQLEQARRELARLRAQQSTGVAENLSVKVLEIDRASGRLYHVEGERQEIRDQREAAQVINQHARKAGAREPFFLILYPRQLSGFPEQRQIEQYRRWFQNVPHGFDNPLAGL